MDTVDVVGGILLRGKKFLVERRRPDDPIDPGFVAIPSGHVDKGELLEEALKREMREELGVAAIKSELIFSGLYVASNGEREMCHCFLVEEWVGEPVANESSEVFWESDVEKLSTEIDRKAVSLALKVKSC